ncbi:MAG: hypothetical protein H0V27_11110 [Pyrinomonadaceae bacterium]|nr:hypothetical protein [Pyrinomonadaceae bacterium]
MYNQPPFNPSAPPTPPPSKSNKKILIGALGAVGCFGLLFAVALGVGGYYFYYRSKPIVNVNVDSSNTPPIANSNGNSNSNANANLNSNANRNGGTIGSNSSNLLRPKVQSKVGKFTLVKAEAMTATPPASNFEVVRDVNAMLTRLIGAANPSEAVYARYRDGAADGYDGIDHYLAQLDNSAAAETMLNSAIAELKSLGFTERRRVPNMGQDRSVLGARVYLQKGDGAYADEAALWTNRAVFLSAVTGKGGNASTFEGSTSY